MKKLYAFLVGLALAVGTLAPIHQAITPTDAQFQSAALFIEGLSPIPAAYADNYYKFDGANDRITGSFTSGPYGEPMTLYALVKFVNHPAANQAIINIGNSGSVNDSYLCRTSGTDNQFQATSTNADTTIQSASSTTLVAGDVDGVWLPVICEFISDSSRALFAGAATGTNGTSEPVTNGIDEISIGENLTQGTDLGAANPNETGVAYVAVWDVQLSDSDETALLAKTCPATIDPTNLIGYWDLQASNATQNNAGVDAGADLTVNGPVFVSGGGPGVTCGVPLTFTSGPTESPITNGFNIAGTLTGSGFGALVAYAVGVAPGDGAPSCTQIKAGQNDSSTSAIWAANETWTTAVADNFDMTATNPIQRADVHVCGSDGTNNTSVTSFTDQDRSPRSGFAHICLTSVAATSIFDLDAYFTPDFAAGFCAEYEDDTNESADCNVSFEVDGDHTLTPVGAGDCDGKRSFNISYERNDNDTGLLTAPTVGNYATDDYVCNGNAAPADISDSTDQHVLLYQSVLMTPIDFKAQISDPDSVPAATATVSGTPPTGTSISGAGVMSGTPSVVNETGVSLGITLTDECGDSVLLTRMVYVTDNALTTPNLVGDTAAEAVVELNVVRPWLPDDVQLTASAAFDAVVPLGDIISQNPAAAATMTATDPVEVVISLGPMPVPGGAGNEIRLRARKRAPRIEGAL